MLSYLVEEQEDKEVEHTIANNLLSAVTDSTLKIAKQNSCKIEKKNKEQIRDTGHRLHIMHGQTQCGLFPQHRPCIHASIQDKD